MWPFKSKRNAPVFNVEKLFKPVGMCLCDNVDREKCPNWITYHRPYKLDDGTITQKPESMCAITWTPHQLMEIKDVLLRIEGVLQGQLKH